MSRWGSSGLGSEMGRRLTNSNIRILEKMLPSETTGSACLNNGLKYLSSSDTKFAGRTAWLVLGNAKVTWNLGAKA
jgi:hypothetical protein